MKNKVHLTIEFSYLNQGWSRFLVNLSLFLEGLGICTAVDFTVLPLNEDE